MFGSDRARALHEQYPPIDLHADTLMWVRSLGYDMRGQHDPPLPRAAWLGHVDIPRLLQARMGAQFLGLVSLPHLHVAPWEVIDEQIDLLEALVRDDARVSIVRTAADIEQCGLQQRTGLALGIEGAHALGGSLHRLEHFASRAVRYLGLVHFTENEAAVPAYGLGKDPSRGLTDFGRDLLALCESRGVIVDLAHINRKGFLEACAMASRPVIVSHTGVLGGFRHWRNIDDEQLEAVARTGGVVGIMFAPRYLGGSGLQDVVRHLQHVLRVGGEDAAALGSDWDGMIVPTSELRDVAHLPLLTDALLGAGLDERQVGKVLRGNVMRVLQAWQ
jgi:membrane dipeptidase